MTSLPSLPAFTSPPMGPRDAITDALHRCLNGLDTNDAALFDSAWTSAATLDLNGNVSEGLPAIHTDCFNKISKLETTHNLSNVRIDIEENASRGAATASVIAHHFRTGQGLDPNARGLLTGAFYYVELVQSDDELWRIDNFRMRTSWVDGDRTVITEA